MVTFMRHAGAGLTVACAAVLGLASVAAADGHVRVVVAFDLDKGEIAEGVAVDSTGDLYTGISAQGRMLKVPGGIGEPETFAVLEGLQEGDFGFVGHAVDASGDVYTAAMSMNPEVNGVWRFDAATGEGEHIAGTEGMAMPNAIDFGEDGTMYVSDTIMGAVWHAPAGAPAQPWVVDPLLLGTNETPLPFPIGANGVDVVDGTVYVGVTEQSSVVAIPINEDGSAGEPSVFLELEGVFVDGIVFDTNGDLYVADPPAHTLWKVTPDGSIDVVADVDDGLDGTSSVALWTDPDGQKTAYVSNQSVGIGTPLQHGPSVIALNLE